jgi:hypothetical protein
MYRLCPNLGKGFQLPRSALLLSPLQVSLVPHFAYASTDADGCPCGKQVFYRWPFLYLYTTLAMITRVLSSALSHKLANFAKLRL